VLFHIRDSGRHSELLAAHFGEHGDALTDLVVSDPKFTTPLGAVWGRVYLVYGSRDFPPLLHIEDLGAHGVVIEGQTGLPDLARVFGGGDLDGDGFPEFGFNVQERTGFNVRGRLLAVRGALALPSAFSWEE